MTETSLRMLRNSGRRSVLYIAICVDQGCLRVLAFAIAVKKLYCDTLYIVLVWDKYHPLRYIAFNCLYKSRLATRVVIICMDSVIVYIFRCPSCGCFRPYVFCQCGQLNVYTLFGRASIVDFQVQHACLVTYTHIALVIGFMVDLGLFVLLLCFDAYLVCITSTVCAVCNAYRAP